MTPPRQVAIVQRRLTHYRVSLFQQLRQELAANGIELKLLIGDGTAEEASKHDAGHLDWAIRVPTRYFAGGRLCWQSFGSHLQGTGMLIVTQENRLLYNHLLLLQRPRRFHLAFWGHGANLQSGNPTGWKERYKRWSTRRVDWWFAYTDISARLVTAADFPPARVTVLNNAIDTSELRRQKASVTVEETRALRASLELSDGPTGVFVGSLYVDKRLDFLFAAAESIRREIGNFHLLIIGDGPERTKVQAWCAKHTWARWVGARFGREKMAYVSVAQVMLNPGLVGLGILDAFICGVPLLTTDCRIHSPEIAYLENGKNGLMTPDVLEDYVATTLRLLRDPTALSALQAGCAASAAEYTVENMARRFANGVARCLNGVSAMQLKDEDGNESK